MFIRNVDGERRAHFRSSGNSGHIQYCPYGSDNGYNPNNTTEEGFDADDIIGRMMVTEQRRRNLGVGREGQGMGGAEDTVPHTIRQVYDMCKAHSCRDMFNGQTIGKILVDSRSIYMFPRGIYGYKLIEAKCRNRFYDGMSIYLETPINEVEYQLELRITDGGLFRRVRNMFYHNANNVIVVVGNWQPSGAWNKFMTKFNTMRQIKVLRQEV